MELFVTCGSGLEPFALTELQNKFDLRTNTEEESSSDQKNSHWKSFPGKLFLKTKRKLINGDGDAHENYLPEDAKSVNDLVHGLKTVERIMGVVHVEAETHATLNKRDVLPALYEMASKVEVKDSLKRWAAIKGIIKTTISESEVKDAEAVTDELPPVKKPRLSQDIDVNVNPTLVGFRVNVRLTGWFKKASSSWEVSKTIGSAISKNMSNDGWNVNLRNPNLEISVFLTDNGIIFAVPMTVKPISERTYLAHSPLRSTIAYAMASLVFYAEQDPESMFILDPMCGTGTILVEVARNFKTQMIYGIDIDSNQVEKCQENLIKAHVQSQVCLLQTDSRNLIPLQIQFDAIICDMPFGRQHGTRQQTLADMPKVISVMDKCLKSNATISLLISSEMSSRLEECISSSVEWTLSKKYPVKLGELPAVIYAFRKFKLNP